MQKFYKENDIKIKNKIDDKTSLFIDYSFKSFQSTNEEKISIPAGTRCPWDVPWRSPKGPNVRDLQGTLRGLLGDQEKNI